MKRQIKLLQEEDQRNEEKKRLENERMAKEIENINTLNILQGALTSIKALSVLYSMKNSIVESLMVIGYNPSHSVASVEVNAPCKILSVLIRCLNNEIMQEKIKNKKTNLDDLDNEDDRDNYDDNEDRDDNNANDDDEFKEEDEDEKEKEKEKKRTMDT